MNTNRKIAFYVVTNINGEKLFKIPIGTFKRFYDPRIADDHQVDNSLFMNSSLGRGHLVRRLDPAWGSDKDMAKLGVENSLFYANCAPEHLKLNHHVWLELEDCFLDIAGAFDIGVSVFSGPKFRLDDPEHLGIQHMTISGKSSP